MEDYKKISLKSGLEIHQQLNTGKLFCSCPSILRNDEPLMTIKRKLNPVVGETGEIDEAALYEKSKNKTFSYEFYDTNCLVELDEEPPHNLNKEALKIAIQISLLLNCKIFPVTQVMRKTVIDGSNTSGFQRTMMIAHDGFIETSFGKVAIDSVFLEEDAARPSGQAKTEVDEPGFENSKVYKLDRLGIPLVEVSTGPHMHSPEQIKEAALKIGEVLRACNVKRGIGTIRQDVNISIKGSERVEIKGFQDPRIMIKTVENEVSRQLKCISDNSCRKEVRKTNPDATTSFLRPMPGSARMYPETDIELVKISRSILDEAKKTLPKLLHEIKKYLKENGLDDEMIALILKDNQVENFKILLNSIENPNLIAKSLVIFPKELAKKLNKKIEEVSQILDIHVLESVLSEVGKNISENEVKLVLQKILEGKSIKDALEKEKIDLKSEIKEIIKAKPKLSKGAYMGLIMAKFQGRVSGKEVSDILDNLLK